MIKYILTSSLSQGQWNSRHNCNGQANKCNKFFYQSKIRWYRCGSLMDVKNLERLFVRFIIINLGTSFIKAEHLSMNSIGWISSSQMLWYSLGVKVPLKMTMSKPNLVKWTNKYQSILTFIKFVVMHCWTSFSLGKRAEMCSLDEPTCVKRFSSKRLYV